MGVNRVSFCFEIFDQALFERICPGKHREYGLRRYKDAVAYCARLGRSGGLRWSAHPWVTNGEIIAGLEPASSSIAAIDWITSVGAVPTVCVFRPLAGTDMADEKPPSTEALIPVFRRLYEACMEKDLPIGLAPNVHVSLVLLPEECRWFLDDPWKYRWKEFKLRAMALAYRHRFARGVDRATRSQGRGASA